MSVLEQLEPFVDETIDRLMATEFRVDPIAGTLFSRVVSVLSSAYKRHGGILERSIIECINSSDRYEAHGIPKFAVSNQAGITVEGAMAAPESLNDTNLPYPTKNPPDGKLQLDAVVFDKHTGVITSYEIKRGNGAFDAGKKRSILRDALKAKVLLKSYGESVGLKPVGADAKVIFYYGVRSLPKPIGIVGEELDDHFEIPIIERVEEVNAYFRSRLFEIISR